MATKNLKFIIKGVDQASPEMKKVEKSAESMGGKFSKMGVLAKAGLAAVAIGAFQAGKSAIKMASDMEETQNKISVIFGDQAESVTKWADTSIKKMGLARQSALDSVALYADMATGMGLTTDEALKLSTEMTQLTADVASFKNVSQERAKTALAGVFTGETEALKGLGVVMTQANLEAYAMNKGITDNINSLDQQEKVMLRAQYVMSALSSAQGDFERTGGGAANQMRKFGELTKELLTVIGEKILPVFNQALTVGISLLEKATTAFQGASSGSGEMSETMKQLADIAQNYIFPALKSVFDFIKQAVILLKQAWDSNFLGMQTITKTQFGIIISTLKTGLALISGILNTVTALMRGDWEGAMLAMQDSGMKMIEANEQSLTKMSDFIFGILNKITEWFTTFTNGISAILEAFSMAFTQAWQNLWKGIKNFFIGIWNDILSVLERMLNKAIDLINIMIKALNKIPGISIPLIQHVAFTKETQEEAQGALENLAIGGTFPKRARGGSVLGGGSYLVGERGPELFTPRGSGTISPNGTGGGVTINITGNTIDSTSRIKQIADEIESRLTRQMQLQKYGLTT